MSIDMLSSSTCVSALTGVTGAPNGPPPLLLAVALLGELLLPGDSFLPAAAPRVGVALVGLAALLPVCGVEASNVAGLRALRSRSTLPVPNAAAAGLLNVLVPSLALPDAEAPRPVAPRGTTCCLPHACSKAANALEVSESHGASSACRRFGVVLVLAEPPAAAAAAWAAIFLATFSTAIRFSSFQYSASASTPASPAAEVAELTARPVTCANAAEHSARSL